MSGAYTKPQIRGILRFVQTTSGGGRRHPRAPVPLRRLGGPEIVALLKEAEAFKEGLTARFAVNRKVTNTAIGRDVVFALADYAPPVLNAHVCQRVAFAESAAAGRAVLENGGGRSPATREIRALTDELLKLSKASA